MVFNEFSVENENMLPFAGFELSIKKLKNEICFPVITIKNIFLLFFALQNFVQNTHTHTHTHTHTTHLNSIYIAEIIFVR